jgi:hypothetical protein
MAYAAGTNCLTQAEDAIKAMLAATTQFQTWLGVSDATRAAERVWIDELPWPNKQFGEEYEPDEWKQLFPHVIIEPPPEGNAITITHYAIGSVWEYLPGYLFILRFERYETAGALKHEDMRLFKNEVGDIMQAMTDIAHEHFAFEVAEPAAAPQRGQYAQFPDLGDLLSWPWLLTKAIA